MEKQKELRTNEEPKKPATGLAVLVSRCRRDTNAPTASSLRALSSRPARDALRSI